MLDLIGTLINDTEDKLKWAIKGFERNAYADSIYSSYATCVSGAKALLTGEGINCNTQIGIINDFEEKLVKSGKFFLASGSFSTQLLRMSDQEPTKEFAAQFLEEAKEFVAKIKEYRLQQVVVK